MANAFKAAEKRYRRYHTPTSSRKQKNNTVTNDFHADWTDVFDPDSEEKDDRFTLHTKQGLKIYTFRAIPGWTIVREALSSSEQTTLFRSCWIDYPQPPARTNLTALYGTLPNLYQAALDGQSFLDVNPARKAADREEKRSDGMWRCSLDKVGISSAAALLNRLRWTSLGPHYNWTTRTYDTTTDHRPLPSSLSAIWRRFAQLVIGDLDVNLCDPNLALVNYYTAGDTLCGHKDDAETDLSQPIVIVSLGSSAIFLMGDQTKDDTPIAVRLRSGDVVVMADRARLSYHGIPRVFCDNHLVLEELTQPDLPVSLNSTTTRISSGRVSISIRCL